MIHLAVKICHTFDTAIVLPTVILELDTNPPPICEVGSSYISNNCDSAVVQLDCLPDCELRHDAQIIDEVIPWALGRILADIWVVSSILLLSNTKVVFALVKGDAQQGATLLHWASAIVPAYRESFDLHISTESPHKQSSISGLHQLFNLFNSSFIIY